MPQNCNHLGKKALKVNFWRLIQRKMKTISGQSLRPSFQAKDRSKVVKKQRYLKLDNLRIYPNKRSKIRNRFAKTAPLWENWINKIWVICRWVWSLGLTWISQNQQIILTSDSKTNLIDPNWTFKISNNRKGCKKLIKKWTVLEIWGLTLALIDLRQRLKVKIRRNKKHWYQLLFK